MVVTAAIQLLSCFLIILDIEDITFDQVKGQGQRSVSGKGRGQTCFRGLGQSRGHNVSQMMELESPVGGTLGFKQELGWL